MLAGHIVARMVADMGSAASQSPAFRRRQHVVRPLRLKPTAGGGQRRPAAVHEVQVSGEVRKDLRREKRNDLGKFFLLLAGLKPMHHVKDVILRLLVRRRSASRRSRSRPLSRKIWIASFISPISSRRVSGSTSTS